MTLTVQQARKKAEEEAIKRVRNLTKLIDGELSSKIGEKPGVTSFYVSISEYCPIDSPIFRLLKSIYTAAGWRLGNPRRIGDNYQVRFYMEELK
ncbi:hypothetical protein KA107_02600 [Candidatus Pacearchaeota archaeon]|nr:hypothetical protein [Candidatus Pacearchaeota archaeon]